MAASFYSITPEIHDRVTTNEGSHGRTLRGIEEAVRRRLRLRVGIVAIYPGQDINGTEKFLRSLGVEFVRTDGVRGVGRGTAMTTRRKPTDSLCGRCGSGTAAVDPEGRVFPCVFSRWLKVGNVRQSSLADIILGDRMTRIRRELNRTFAATRRLGSATCVPDDCNPKCAPITTRSPQAGCGPNCFPGF